MAWWRSGYAAACKAVYSSSNLDQASNSPALQRFVDCEFSVKQPFTSVNFNL
jgi:hypothetical protein